MTTPFMCWDPGKVDSYFNIEASSTVLKLGWDVFRQLHVPIRKMEVLGTRLSLPTEFDRVRSGDERPFIDEEGLLRAVTEATERENFLIAIRGGPGSGKSHVIRWLEMRLQDYGDRFFPIPVPRELDSVAAVLNSISQVSGVEMHFEGNTDASVEDLTQALVYTIKLHMRGEDKNVVDSRAMRELIRDSIQQFRDQRIERRNGRGEMLAPDVRQADLLTVFAEYATGGQDAAIDFSSRFTKLYNQIWVTYVTGVDVNVPEFMGLVQNSKLVAGRRPVLLMEDLTSFEVLHRAVLNFLASLSAAGFVAVMGWTTAYERDNVQTNILDRLALRVSLTDESSGSAVEETYAFRDESDIVELARTYMRAVRKERCDRGCLNCACTAGSGDGLYPFTETAIKKFYNGLIDRDTRAQRRTPRLLLSRVMQPLLKAAVTFQRFPKMDSVLVIDPAPIPAAYRALGEEFADWVQAKLWFTADDTPDSFFEDLGIKRPVQEPVADTVEPKEQTEQRDIDRRAKLERAYQEEYRKLDMWLNGETKGGTLQSVDSWHNRLEALVPKPQAGSLSPGPGRHVEIEGSGAGRSAPFAITIQRNQQSLQLLQSVARREIYGTFEADWEATYVLGNLAISHVEAERGWSEYLVNTVPIHGLFLEVVALDTAFKGQLDGDDLPCVMTAVVNRPPNRGAPRLSGPMIEVRKQVIEPIAEKVGKGFTTAYREKQDTFDMLLLLKSWQAYRLMVSRGRRLDITAAIRFGTESFSAGEISNADQAVRSIYKNKLQDEIGLTQKTIAQTRNSPPLGKHLEASMQQLREAYLTWKTPAIAATLWGGYQTGLDQFRSLLPPDASDLEAMASALEQGWKGVEDSKSLLAKLSKISALRPNTLRAAAEIGAKVQDVIRTVEKQLNEEEPDIGADVTCSQLKEALRELQITREELP